MLLPTSRTDWRSGEGAAPTSDALSPDSRRGASGSRLLYFTEMECSQYPAVKPDFGIVLYNCSEPPIDWTREHWGLRPDRVP